ncbi:MAG: CvpA family protein [FCB group bacterium]|nr:CvpA family protein [FCB group bacterium]
MNIVDYILLALLVAMVIVGSKKGLLRELTAFFTLIPAVVVSINFMDIFSVIVYEKIGGSPMVVTFLSFILLLGIAYAVFKLLGMGIARIVHLQRKGRKDQMGGAFLGFMRGWVVMSFIFFLLFLLPMPAGFYLAVEDSFFGPTLIKTVPFMYETSTSLHPDNTSFFSKVESALMLKEAGVRLTPETRSDVDLVLYQIQRFFTVGPGT